MSKHLDDIIDKSRGSAVISTVFFDIVSYSQRKTAIQQKVIHKFNEVLARTLDQISAAYVKECQSKALNLADDLIKIPTGDGAAIIFSFGGMHNIALDCATTFLSEAVASREDQGCAEFTEKGWCNCHDHFDTRIGISYGGSIIYRDINHSYNVAGNSINLAARVMALGDRQTILLDVNAYKDITDMNDDIKLDKKFRDLGPLPIKHGFDIDVYQYIGAGENYINGEKPKKAEVFSRTAEMQKTFPIMGSGISSTKDEDMLGMLDLMEVVRRLPGFERTSSLFTSGTGGMEKLKEYVDLQTKLNALMNNKQDTQ